MTNREIAELLALTAENSLPPLSKALKKAARRALVWPVEAARLWSSGESLQVLPGLGPALARRVTDWMEQPPEVIDPPPIRQGFLTLTEVQRALEPLADNWKALGDLQLHTCWSDGSAEIEDMADAARARGYVYLAITDHAVGLKIAGGLSLEKLTQQRDHIDHLNRRWDNFRLLHSSEVNLDPKGSPDLPKEVLEQLDLVLACFHSKLRLKEDQTERYLAALRSPIHILGHPRGRIYNYRQGLKADWPRVFEEAAGLDKAVEIDGFPDRQDLDMELLEEARRAGCRISLGSDAHGVGGLAYLDYALAAAWLAGIPRERILNFMELEELLEWTSSVRQGWS